MIPSAILSKITLVLTGGKDKISESSLLVNDLEIFNPTGNDAIRVGDSNVDATYIPRAANTITTFSLRDVPGEPRHFDLSNMYITGTLGNVVTIQYINRV